MRAFPVIAAAAVLIWPATRGTAREPLRLQPSTRWVLDYAEDSCRIARGFGDGDRLVTLALEQYEPEETFKVKLIGKGVRLSGSGQLDVALRFGPHEAQLKTTAMTGTAGTDPVLILEGEQRLAPLTKAEEDAQKDGYRRGVDVDPAPLGQAREAAATWLEITRGLRGGLVLETGRMDKPLAALRKCAWDTVGHWGLDVEQQKRLSRKLAEKPKSRPWLHASDYPPKMIQGGYQGIVHFRLIVDATGTPTSCHIQQSTRPREFDDAVCRGVMKRARFEPALDASGKPVPSYWVQTVHFRMM